MKKINRASCGGWTLIELLVAISLSIILVGAMAQAFSKATDVFEIGSARLSIYNEVRTALDNMGRDLTGAMSTNTGSQRFALATNVQDQFDSEYQTFNSNGWMMDPKNGTGGAADMIGVVSHTSIAGDTVGRGLAYRILPSKDPSLLDKGEGRAKTVYHDRTLGVLQRAAIPIQDVKDDPNIYYGPDKSNSSSAALWTTENSGPTSSNPKVFVGYLAEYILSFNVEVLANTNSDIGYFDLDEDPANVPSPQDKYLNSSQDVEKNKYPIGSGEDDEPDIPDAIRVTIRFTEGAKGQQERVVQRVFWLPMR